MSVKMDLLKESILQLLTDYPDKHFTTADMSQMIYGREDSSTAARISNALTAHNWYKEIGFSRVLIKTGKKRQRWAYSNSGGNGSGEIRRISIDRTTGEGIHPVPSGGPGGSQLH